MPFNVESISPDSRVLPSALRIEPVIECILERTGVLDACPADAFPQNDLSVRPRRGENFVLPLALLLTLTASTVAFAPPPDQPIIDINILKILGDLGGALIKVPAFYFDNGLLGHVALGGTAGLIFKAVESVKEKGFLVGLAHLLEKDTLEKMFTGAVIVGVFDNLSGIKDAFDFSIKQVSLANFAKIGAALGVGVKAISEIVAHHKISLSETNFKELGLSAVDGGRRGLRRSWFVPHGGRAINIRIRLS